MRITGFFINGKVLDFLTHRPLVTLNNYDQQEKMGKPVEGNSEKREREDVFYDCSA